MLGLPHPEQKYRLLAIIDVRVKFIFITDALSGLARSDSLAAAGRSLDTLSEITRVYEAGVKAFEKK